MVKEYEHPSGSLCKFLELNIGGSKFVLFISSDLH
jgi:hypothetical protein